MNLQAMFETQRKLDERIIKDKGLEGQDLLPDKFRALLTELGELSNEERSFKFWSEDREPRTVREVIFADLKGVPVTKVKNPLLEEYVDCLHFILSIGIDLKLTDIEITNMDSEFKNVNEAFRHMFNWVAGLDFAINDNAHFLLTLQIEKVYQRLLSVFNELGKLLGFTWDEIENAYYEKNRINHTRQESGY